MTKVEQQLILFARMVIRRYRETLSDLDGQSLEDMLEELGLLARVPVMEPCGEDCRCADYIDAFPVFCPCLRDGILEEEER